jgi:monomeric sarcosine oxidase
MRKNYDCIVIGTGGVGSSSIYYLSQQGVQTLGLDRFSPGHDRGSSHGDTRVIRMAYFEHPNYVPLLRRAYELWNLLSATCEQQLYHEVGLIEIGSPNGEVVPGVLRSAQEHNLKIERFSANEVTRRFPGFELPESMTAVFEQQAGYLSVEACVLAYAREAQKLGAKINSDETVMSWKATSKGVTVTTDHHTYEAERLIITPGAWASDLLRNIGIKFTVRRKSLFWYEAPAIYQATAGCPVFLFETPSGIFYGYPQIDAWGLKIAEHTGGQSVVDPLTVDRNINDEDRARIESFLSNHLPGVTRTLRKHVVCLYTMSPDSHFVLDRHPHYPQVAFVAGLSGHGFKFASVLGEILADLTCNGRTSLPVDFLRCDRPMP